MDEIRLIACDVDGTLLQQGETELRPQLFDLIRRLAAQGVEFCVASGRAYSSVRELFGPVAGQISFVCENGGVVYRDGLLVARNPVPEDLGREVATAIWQREDCELLAADGETCWMIPRIPERAEQMKPYMGDRIGVASHPDELPAQLVKVTAFREEGAAALLPEFTARWGAKLHVALAGRRWLDVNACTKATGLAALCGLVGIQPREVMAFGDNFNDQPMLDWVGRPYVMRGADPALRALYPAADRPEPMIEALLNALE